MEDKTFELLTEMYGAITNRFEAIDTRLDGIDARLEGMDGHIIWLENKLSGDSKALFNGYRQNDEMLKLIKDKIKELSEKVYRHGMKMHVIEGGRK